MSRVNFSRILELVMTLYKGPEIPLVNSEAETILIEGLQVLFPLTKER
jgi:hypothetical protein